MTTLTKNKWFIVLILIMVETFGQFFINKAYRLKQNNQTYVIIGVISYAIVGFLFYLLLMASNSMIWGNIFWNIGAFSGSTIIAVLVNKEKISIYKILSFILLITAVIVYEMETFTN